MRSILLAALAAIFISGCSGGVSSSLSIPPVVQTVQAIQTPNPAPTITIQAGRSPE